MSTDKETRKKSASELPPAVLGELRKIVGAENVLTDPVDLLVYSCDAITYHQQSPAAVVFPADTSQTAAAVRLLLENDIPFLPRGSGTGLSGGALPLPDSVVLQTSHMNRILSADPENRMAEVQPGVINSFLTKALEPMKLHFAPDPSSQVAAVLGGNIAENAGGPHCLKYGVTGNHVLGLEVVLGDGTVAGLGSPWGDAAGLDLVGLFVGSEGTLGICTQATLKLTPLPQAVQTLLIGFPRLEEAGRTVSQIIAGGIIPAALEMIDHNGIEAVEQSVYAAGYPRDVAAVLLVEIDGFQAGLEEQAQRIRAIAEANHPSVIRMARNEEERARLWAGRKRSYGAQGQLAPDCLVQDVTVPRSLLPEMLEEVYRIAEEYDLHISNCFHAGDGNLHPHLLFDRRDKALTNRVLEAAGQIVKACLARGGTISGEHGIGVDKLPYMRLVFSEEDLEVMRRLRSVFNPRNLCNPGKLIPEPEKCESRQFGADAA